MRATPAPVTPEDGVHMRRALALAARGWGQTAPNPMVGAVVVRDGAVVGEGWHTRLGAAHAEVEALHAAGESARGATMYVTLEPCNHQGRTGPCSEALLVAGITRVVVATRDPNPRAQGGGARLRAAGVDVTIGLEDEAAHELNAPFFHALTADRPWLTLKLAVSLDGALADYIRQPGWLTGPAARAEVHRMRAGADAIAVGIGTALADDPRLTVREGVLPRVPPTRIVFDSSARLPLTSRLVATAREAPVIVVCWAPDPAHAAALARAGVDLLHARSLPEALRALKGRGVHSLLVEGGAQLAASLLRETLVDRLVIFRAPLLLGAGAVAAFGGVPASTVRDAARWRIVRATRLDEDEMTVYAPLQ